MYRTTQIHRRAITLIGLSMGVASAYAGGSTQGATGLGQSWPNAQDVSTNPQWHAYAFNRDGIRYVQINDAGGNVHALFAIAGKQVLVLPSGSDSGRVNTPQQPLAGVTSLSGVTVYRDDSVRVALVATANGAAWNVQPQVAAPKQATAPNATVQADTCSLRECGGDLNQTPSANTLQRQ